MQPIIDFFGDYLDEIMHNVDYRLGFFLGLSCAGGLWLVWVIPVYLYKRWLVMRQFFEPIKKPGKAPTELGQSPAGMLLGCLWPIVFLAGAIALWFAYWFGGIPGS